jgi:hypothetical protein
VVYYVHHTHSSQGMTIRKEEYLAGTIETNPAENCNWRRHKNACPFYRERWFPGNDVAAGEPMYQVFCMKNTPPVTFEEQERCLHSKTSCWRLANKRQAKAEESSNEETPSSAR